MSRNLKDLKGKVIFFNCSVLTPYSRLIALRDSLNRIEGFNYVDLLLMVLFMQLKKQKELYSAVQNNRRLTKVLTSSKRTVRRLESSLHNVLKPRADSPKLSKADFLFWVTEPTELKQLINIVSTIHGKHDYLIVTDKKQLFDQINTSFSKLLIRKDLFHNRVKHGPTFQAIRRSDVFRTHEKELLLDLLRTRIPIMDALCKQFEAILCQTTPKWVFIGYDITPEGRLLATLCKKHRIPAFNVQHGIIPDDLIHKEHIVDKLFVYGIASRQKLTGMGVEPSRIEVSGAPYLDHFNEPSKEENNIILKNLEISPEQSYILIATSGPGHRTSASHFEKMVKAFMMLSEQFPYERFVVKMHRKDSLANYEKSKAAFPANRLILVQHNAPHFPESIFDWIKSCKILITGNSAAASEALLMNKPVFTVDLMNEYKGVDFIDAGATIHCTSEDELHSKLAEFLQNPSAFEATAAWAVSYLEDGFFKLDGKASERIIDHVKHHYPCAE